MGEVAPDPEVAPYPDVCIPCGIVSGSECPVRGEGYTVKWLYHDRGGNPIWGMCGICDGSHTALFKWTGSKNDFKTKCQKDNVFLMEK